MDLTSPILSKKKKIIIWLAGVSFLLFQFFLQLSSGIVIGAIMHEQAISAFTAGLLSSAFYYVYTSMQIPVGLLFDRFDARILLAFNAIICALGCFIFAVVHSIPALFFGRLVIGAGSSFAFVGLSHLLRRYFPIKRYAFLVGFSETLGFTVTVLGMLGLGTFVSLFGWRYFIASAGVLGIFIAFFCWRCIPSTIVPVSQKISIIQQIKLILQNKLAWINGLFVCLEFSVISVFAALWAIPFFQLKMHCTLAQSGMLTSMILLGAGLSCPIFGQLATRFNKRKPLIYFSCIATAILFLIALFVPIHSKLLMGGLMFLIGLVCGAYMLAYSISNELAPRELLSTCTGFTNTLAMLSAPLLQPLIGYLLDSFNLRHGVYSLENYQLALLVIPIGLLLASFLVRFLPEKSF